MNIIHVMQDGSVRESVEGVKIPNKEFYIIFNEIRNQKIKKTKAVINNVS